MAALALSEHPNGGDPRQSVGSNARRQAELTCTAEESAGPTTGEAVCIKRVLHPAFKPIVSSQRYRGRSALNDMLLRISMYISAVEMALGKVLLVRRAAKMQ